MRASLFLSLFATATLSGCLNDGGSSDKPMGPQSCEAKLQHLITATHQHGSDSPYGSKASPVTTGNIISVSAYPPIAGIGPKDSRFRRAEDFEGTFPGVETGPDGDSIMQWIPPVWIRPGTSPSGRDTSMPRLLSPITSTIRVGSKDSWVAHFRIYDEGTGILVRDTTESFGLYGELLNPFRASQYGMITFLYWHGKDALGKEVQTGLYRWKISFDFKDGNGETYEVLTGRIGPECRETTTE
jgi:hypothetical protein